jgi:hypothetical protein
MSNNICIKSINIFFKNTLKNIYKTHKDVKCRDRKIEINDLLKFIRHYIKKENTKESATTADKKIFIEHHITDSKTDAKTYAKTNAK